MRILVSNDDGIQARGIAALSEALLPLGEVIVVAPNRERSAASHSLTLEHPLRAALVPFFIPGVKLAFAVNGTPSDCVKLALSSLVKPAPDIVVTGINRGANLAVDVFYSGTVAGAFEGVFQGIPSIAFSLASYEEQADLSGARFWMRRLVERLLQFPAVPNILFNINIPALPPEQIQGIKVTRQGKVRYGDSYDRRDDPHGRPYYWLKGEPEIIDKAPDTDIVAVQSGFISVTPIRAELTDDASLKSTRSLLEGLSR